jgi:Fe-S-cluster containining protein
VSFYWAECDDAAPEGVPSELTEKISQHRVAMKGTNRPGPRCIALEGEVGAEVRCAIYSRRPSVCRDLPYSWQDGMPEEKCDRSRMMHGMKPLIK